MIDISYRPGVSDKLRAQTAPSVPKQPGSPALYPTLNVAVNPDLRDYSIISMPGTEKQNSDGVVMATIPDNIDLLIPQASQLMSSIKDGLKDLKQSLSEYSHVTITCVCVCVM